MKIGIVSDTHNHLSNVARIVELFNAAGVDRVVHTGDITQAKTLDVFARLDAPLFGVWGNNDVERDALDVACAEHRMEFHHGPLELAWCERRILVVHDPRELAPERLRGRDVALHGHDHRHTIEVREGALVINPGECAGHMPGFNAVAVLDLVRLSAEILNF
jgi:putative phosphoesterase